MNDGKRQVMGESKPDENPIATIYYENGTELTGKAVTLQDGTVGVRIPANSSRRRSCLTVRCLMASNRWISAPSMWRAVSR